MKHLLLIGTLVATLILAGCGGEKYGAGVDASAQMVKVKDVFLKKNLLGQKVTLEGKIVSQCQSNGCWFFLQDETGQLYIDMATNKFSLPS
ncbi:MAG: DNA-binding protein, partial [Deltaproteobacteria bacterium]|nr:DNA-binding protein [Deltaproteobacteria bacterium]